MMASIVYILSTITCVSCAYLLLRSWKKGRNNLLFYSGICFIGLALNNALATIDVNTATALMDLSTIRLSISLASVGILVFGLSWEAI